MHTRSLSLQASFTNHSLEYSHCLRIHLILCTTACHPALHPVAVLALAPTLRLPSNERPPQHLTIRTLPAARYHPDPSQGHIRGHAPRPLFHAQVEMDSEIKTEVCHEAEVLAVEAVGHTATGATPGV